MRTQAHTRTPPRGEDALLVFDRYARPRYYLPRLAAAEDFPRVPAREKPSAPSGSALERGDSRFSAVLICVYFPEKGCEGDVDALL